MLEFKIHERTLIVSIDGELDHHISRDIRDRIDREIDRSPIINIIFDLNDLTFMDSSGIGVIIGRYKKIKEQDGKAAVINLAPKIEKIFELSGIFKIIPKFESLEDAINNL